MIVLGIDEAGYGPLLGPLVVAASAFRVADGAGLDSVSARLRKSVAEAGLRVGDSKRVFGDSRDLSALEVPVLAFLQTSAPHVARFDELLAAVGVDPGCRAAPWYSGTAPCVPARAAVEPTGETALRLSNALRANGIEFVALAADVVVEARFNATLVSGNKADLLFASGTGLVDRLAAHRRAGEGLAVVFDRQGGRHFYGATLQKRWPQALVQPLSESSSRSDYRLHFGEGAAFVRFEVEADGAFPQVGLASMLAKYLRESFMGLFNSHFGALGPGVRPTAGYVEDGRRWLSETRALREAAGVPDSDLVRRR